MTTRKLQRLGSGDSSIIIDPAETTAAVIEAESSKKLQSSQYKGVVPQPNGRWGAQIYEKHQRVWLGTFNEQADAAKAYDTAAQRFRGRDAVTNFKSLSESEESDRAELEFLNLQSKSEIVDMLRKHTYADELLQKKRDRRMNSRDKDVVSSCNVRSRHHLFDKTVTPSDVGKLNRLVIPKQHAEKHFPMGVSETDGGSKGILLNFEDGNGKVWRFRYSYWNSSQSYVLTKGWSRFVKEKSLQAGDVVSFEEYFCGEGMREKKLYIECKRRVGSLKVFRLFGVDIVRVEGGLDCDDGWINANGKRSSDGRRKLDLFFKKQLVGAL